MRSSRAWIRSRTMWLLLKQSCRPYGGRTRRTPATRSSSPSCSTGTRFCCNQPFSAASLLCTSSRPPHTSCSSGRKREESRWAVCGSASPSTSTCSTAWPITTETLQLAGQSQSCTRTTLAVTGSTACSHPRSCCCPCAVTCTSLLTYCSQSVGVSCRHAPLVMSTVIIACI